MFLPDANPLPRPACRAEEVAFTHKALGAAVRFHFPILMMSRWAKLQGFLFWQAWCAAGEPGSVFVLWPLPEHPHFLPASACHPAYKHEPHTHTHTHSMPHFLPNALSTLEKYMVVIISSRQSSRHQDAHDILISGGELQTDDRGCMVMYQRQKCVTLKQKREILPSEKKHKNTS